MTIYPKEQIPVNLVINDPERRAINRDAGKILRPVKRDVIKTKWTKAEMEKVRWQGLISKCPKCGDRGYEGGYCFGCESPIRRKCADSALANTPVSNADTNTKKLSDHE